MKSFIDNKYRDYAFKNTRLESQLLKDLTNLTNEKMEMPQMLCGQLEGRLLNMLVSLVQPMLLVEIGTFTGYSALTMAEAMPKNSKLITCDNDPEAIGIAQEFFNKSQYGEKIEIREGPAIDTIRSIREPIDFSFIDADKAAYPAYYEEILSRTRIGGLIVLDNMFWLGQVLDPKDESSTAIDQTNDIITNDTRVENVFLTIRDGVQLVRKIAD